MDRPSRPVLDAQAYWQEKTASYVAGLDGPYHRHRLRVIADTMAGSVIAGARCYDFGCGEGVFAAYLVGLGGTVQGNDIDPAMIARLGGRPELAAQRDGFVVGGSAALARIASASIDHLFALNVVSYMDEAEEELFYTQAARVVRPGGHCTLSHSNTLFDLYTLNSFTRDFFRREFDFGDPADIGELLTRPDVPSRTRFPVRENPLAYRYKLARYGFREMRQGFANLHPRPPLLMRGVDFDDINARAYRDTVDWPEAERWKLMFACSIFVSHALRT